MAQSESPVYVKSVYACYTPSPNALGSPRVASDAGSCTDALWCSGALSTDVGRCLSGFDLWTNRSYSPAQRRGAIRNRLRAANYDTNASFGYY